MYEIQSRVALAESFTLALLSVGYAMFGACLGVMRNLRANMSKSTFHPVYSKIDSGLHVTHAAFAGLAVGLFGASLEGGREDFVLAAAFVTGYLVQHPSNRFNNCLAANKAAGA